MSGGIFIDIVRFRYIKDRISKLPSGNITYKTINGKKYPYYQWTENKKQRSRIVKGHELKELSEKIKQRKSLEKKIKESGAPVNITDDFIEGAPLFSDISLSAIFCSNNVYQWNFTAKLTAEVDIHEKIS